MSSNTYYSFLKPFSIELITAFLAQKCENIGNHNVNFVTPMFCLISLFHVKSCHNLNHTMVAGTDS